MTAARRSFGGHRGSFVQRGVINTRTRLEQVTEGGRFFSGGQRRRLVVDTELTEVLREVNALGQNMRAEERAEDALAYGVAAKRPLGIAPLVHDFAAVNNYNRCCL